MTTHCRAGPRAATVPLAHVMAAVQVPFGRVGGTFSFQRFCARQEMYHAAIYLFLWLVESIFVW